MSFNTVSDNLKIYKETYKILEEVIKAKLNN
jgi:hypothetical protein